MRKESCLSLDPVKAYQLGYLAAKSSFRLSVNPYVNFPAYDECSDSWVSGWYAFYNLKA